MALPRETVTKEYPRELDNFTELIRSLNDEEWETASRCDGWSVGDVARHVAGTLHNVATGNLEGLGTPEVTKAEVDDRAGRSPSEVADEIDADKKVAVDLLAAFDDDAWNGPVPAPNIDGTLGDGVEALWFDAYLHADDIRSVIGRESVTGGPGLEAGLSHVATILSQQKWGPATLALDGVQEFPVNGGGGRKVTGDPFQFLLAGTGRGDPAKFDLDESVNIYR
jgi:uncharacterized protein (TIGR03083 family)